MYMKSKELDIEQDIIDSSPKKLSEWLYNIKELIKLNDQDTVLYVKNNSRDVLFLITKDFDTLMNIEQLYIVKNCSMTLKQWRESIEKLIRQYSEDFYLYLSEETETTFYLSEMFKD